MLTSELHNCDDENVAAESVWLCGSRTGCSMTLKSIKEQMMEFCPHLLKLKVLQNVWPGIHRPQQTTN